LRPARPAGLCLVSEWHVRDIFVPNPNRIHVCVPPPPRFLARRAPGGQWRWRWGACALRSLGGDLGWGGAKFSIFRFSCSMAQKLDTGSDNYGKTNHTSRSGGFAEFRPIPGRLWGGGPDALVRCPTQCTLADAWPSEPTPRGAAPRRRSPPRSHRRIRLLTAARLTAAARPTRTKLRGSQRITRKRTSCPRDGPQPSSAAACEAGRAVLGLTPRSSR
jgi:hypothetical protein